MKKSTLAWGAGLILIAFAAALITYPQLPSEMPTHWNIHGEVDGYMAKHFVVFLMPAIMLAMLGLTKILPWLSPKCFEVDNFRETYEFLMILTIGLLGYIHAITLWAGLSDSTDVSRALVAGIFLFFGLLGNVLGKVRRNFWIGVRVPWTLASERVWNNTHRFAARLYCTSGITGCIAVLAGLPFVPAFVMLIAAALIPVVYSLVEYKSLEKRGEI
ncbi:MAG: SdpI family protein [Elusimicrobia bacterium]|nr:SdpI family protein [Elusimicrobiota bacterium]